MIIEIGVSDDKIFWGETLPVDLTFRDEDTNELLDPAKIIVTLSTIGGEPVSKDSTIEGEIENLSLGRWFTSFFDDVQSIGKHFLTVQIEFEKHGQPIVGKHQISFTVYDANA